MMGTSFSVTAAMRLMPPRRIIPINMAATVPVTLGDTPKAFSIACAIELLCERLPMPKETGIHSAAKSRAIHLQ